MLSIYEKDTSKMTLVRTNFDSYTDVSGTDLLVGLCEGGPHGDYFDFYEDEEEWRSAMISLASRGCTDNNMGKVKTLYLTECSNPYPIIYNERK